jgi:myo-inositol-1-phosphate synthase
VDFDPYEEDTDGLNMTKQKHNEKEKHCKLKCIKHLVDDNHHYKVKK